MVVESALPALSAPPAAVIPDLPVSSVREPVGIDALASSLAEIGLEPDRIVELPGSDKMGLVLTVPAADATAAWVALRRLTPATGWHPVVTGGESLFERGSTELDRLLWRANVRVSDSRNPDSMLSTAETIDPPAWFAERAEALSIDLDEMTITGELQRAPEPEETDGLADPVDQSGMSSSRLVELILLPASQPWESPAYLLWGGVNEQPDTEVQVALARRWFETYGAEIIRMTESTIEFIVPRSPSTDSEAIELAVEHLLYAPDSADRSPGALADQAAELLDADLWFFWWD